MNLKSFISTLSTSVFVLTVVVISNACDVPDDLATPTVADLPDGTSLHRVEIHQPLSLTVIQSGQQDHQGRPVGLDCMTCHSVRDEHNVPDNAHGLESVHAGMVFAHGALKCLACHDSDRADRLRLADGSTFEMVEAQKLCAQCHGPQTRDWENGSHGGMRGYWDRRRGPSTRNHCVDCHDPHDPRYPSFHPAPPPQDRFLSKSGDHK